MNKQHTPYIANQLQNLQKTWGSLQGTEYEKIKWLIGNHKGYGLACETVKDFLEPTIIASNPLSETWNIKNIATVQYFYPGLDMREHFGIIQQI